MQAIIDQINSRINSTIFFELSIYKYEKGNLVIGGSQDLIYFHEIEITFKSVYTIACNSDFIVDTTKKVIELVEDIEELRTINKQYGIIKGYTLFKLHSADGETFYIAAQSIAYEEKTVKYYEE